jgi:hypothetical protein
MGLALSHNNNPMITLAKKTLRVTDAKLILIISGKLTVQWVPLNRITDNRIN